VFRVGVDWTYDVVVETENLHLPLPIILDPSRGQKFVAELGPIINPKSLGYHLQIVLEFASRRVEPAPARVAGKGVLIRMRCQILLESVNDRYANRTRGGRRRSYRVALQDN
jgi:hypothetical protein